jgi:microcystin-dependent protein
MASPFTGQIQPLAFSFAPRGWAQCNGQLLAISQNAALFALLGTTYGGNGTSTFALPNLQSRVPLHFGTLQSGETFVLGEQAGQENVMLNVNELPAHSHAFMGAAADANASPPADGQSLAKAALASGTPNNFYGPMTTPQPLNTGSLGPAGNNQSHTNIQPYLTINWCIALVGIFPSRN